jgi:hypothetical protein
MSKPRMHWWSSKCELMDWGQMVVPWQPWNCFLYRAWTYLIQHLATNSKQRRNYRSWFTTTHDLGFAIPRLQHLQVFHKDGVDTSQMHKHKCINYAIHINTSKTLHKAQQTINNLEPYMHSIFKPKEMEMKTYMIQFESNVDPPKLK